MSDQPSPCLLDPGQMEEQLLRMCREIAASLGAGEEVCLVGIRSRGLPLARRMRAMLGHALGKEPPLGILDITLYRDDLSELPGSPILRSTEIPFPLRGRTVVLVDDVIYTGRTARAALDALQDHGRPRRVRLAALVDRGGREVPIQPDFAGLRLAVSQDQRISVRVHEIDGEDAVLLESRS